ncbi:MAG: succinate dehydrogenase / fumarate reductase cytochrome b subunit [Gammaproteobacteria bacterium]|jgi:succinate dehydrogenase / fumarate reductase cytochrome b subunit
MSNLNRPLSPHLQVYRPQLTSVLSIAHRISGVALCAGVVALTIWLMALAGGAQSFAQVSAILGSAFGQLVLFAFTLALFYHLCNGIRHLFWDAGYGFELSTVYASGKAVLVASTVLTVVVWVAAIIARSSA